ncbi:hypothetical protein MMC29_001553 [Sticta canariensis]|nr:hypothetical protein [Sticta canariensis]
MNARYQFSRFAALGSSRAIIEAFQVLRNADRPVIIVCNIVDFQTFTAGMIILIAILGYSQYYLGHDTEQEKKDWEIAMDLDKVTSDCPKRSHVALLRKPLKSSRIYAMLEDVILIDPKTFMRLFFLILEKVEVGEVKHSHHGKSHSIRFSSNYSLNKDYTLSRLIHIELRISMFTLRACRKSSTLAENEDRLDFNCESRSSE